MNNDNQQKLSDLQKSAKEFAQSGAAMAKHAKAAAKVGANLASEKVERIVGENGVKSIKQARTTAAKGINAAAGKIESVAAKSDSQILKKATSSRKNTLITTLFFALLLATLALLFAGRVGELFGGSNTQGAEQLLGLSEKELVRVMGKPDQIKPVDVLADYDPYIAFWCYESIGNGSYATEVMFRKQDERVWYINVSRYSPSTLLGVSPNMNFNTALERYHQMGYRVSQVIKGTTTLEGVYKGKDVLIVLYPDSGGRISSIEMLLVN